MVIDGVNTKTGMPAGARAPLKPAPKMTWAEENLAPLLDKFLPSTSTFDARNNPVTQGLADPGVGIMQLIANAPDMYAGTPLESPVGPSVNRAVRANEAGYQASRGADAGTLDPARIATNIFNPLVFKAAGMIPQASTAPARVAQGAATGGLFGAAQPVTTDQPFGGEKTAQFLLSSLFGGAVTPVVEGAKALGRGVRSILPGGAEAAKLKMQRDLVGDALPDVVQALRSAKELVPGSAPTAGEAISSVPRAAPLAAHQRSVSSIPKNNISGLFAERAAQQEAARRAAIDSVAQTPQALESAVTARGNVTRPMYEAAKVATGPVDVAPIVAQIDDLMAKNPGNRALIAELSRVRENLFDGDILRTNPEQIMSAVDDLKAVIKKPENSFISGELSGFRDQIRQAIPGMAQADEAFARESVPVNQMSVGQYLRDKLLAPLSGAERPASFAGAMRDAPGTLKRSTGMARFDDLGEVLDPAQMGSVKGILDDLARKAEFESLATQGGVPPIGSRTPQIPNTLDQKVAMINRLLSFVHRGRDEAINRMAAQDYLNPNAFADALEKSVTPTQSATWLTDLIRNIQNPVLIGAPAVAVGQGVN